MYRYLALYQFLAEGILGDAEVVSQPLQGLLRVHAFKLSADILCLEY